MDLDPHRLPFIVNGRMVRYKQGIWRVIKRVDIPDEFDNGFTRWYLVFTLEHQFGPLTGTSIVETTRNAFEPLNEMEVIALVAAGLE